MGFNFMLKCMNTQSREARGKECGPGKSGADKTDRFTLDLDNLTNKGKQFLVVCLKYSLPSS